MNNFWDERYKTTEYVYGTEPNEFLKIKLQEITPGKILFPAEGEGRNAVFAAGLGWEVQAFDTSIEGKMKALQLAKNKNVSIQYQINSYESANFQENFFDCIALIFAHTPPHKRKEYHQKLIRFLKPGGQIILESFSKKQIKRNTGGPQNIDMLHSTEELSDDFSQLSDLMINEIDYALNEGKFHQGIASIIRLTGKK